MFDRVNEVRVFGFLLEFGQGAVPDDVTFFGVVTVDRVVQLGADQVGKNRRSGSAAAPEACQSASVGAQRTDVETDAVADVTGVSSRP